MVRFFFGILIVLTVSQYGSILLAQCTKDTDCKGDRICENGQCVDQTKALGNIQVINPNVEISPTPKVSPTVSPTTTPVEQKSPSISTGWSLAAGIIGLLGTAAVPALSIGSAVVTSDAHNLYDLRDCQEKGECSLGEDREATSWALGVPAIMTVAIIGPVVFFGGKSAWRHPEVDGVLGLRIAGMAAYGISLSCAGAMVGVGIAGGRVPPALIGITGGVGAISLLALSLDALISRTEAKRKSTVSVVGNIELAPLIAPVFTVTNPVVLAGLQGRF